MKQKQIKVPQITPVSNKGPRNAFDLSQRNLFHAPVGALLPVHSLELMPGDHVSLKISDFMRVMPCNSAAFIDCKGVYETFFVPYSQLWKPWHQFITSMNDFNNTLLANKHLYNGVAVPPFNIPYINMTALFNQMMAGTVPNSDAFGYDLKYGFYRLADLLGYGRCVKADGTTGLWNTGAPMPTSMPVNLFRFAAYQKIYQDVYRNTQYEDYDVYSFELSDLADGLNDVAGSVLNAKRQKSLFQMRYRNYGLDLLTNIRPACLVDAYSSAAINALKPSTYQEQWAGGQVYAAKDDGQSIYTDASTAKINDVGIQGLDESIVSVRTLRAAFAYQNLLDTMGRAPKTYKDQMKAIYGVDIPVGLEGKVQYVGGVESPYQFGDVTNTAVSADDHSNTVPYQTGLGGTVVKGTGSGSGYMEFDAPDHGILMTIYSVIPENQYDGLRIDPFNAKTSRTNYYIPQYDHIGMQPLYQSAVTLRNDTLSGTTHVNNAMSNALGWQPRYSEYKTAIDINHGQFISGDSLSSYCSNRTRTAAITMDWLSSLALRDLKITPNIFDSIFKVSYNGKESTDPFFGSVQINVTKVSNMDRESLPNV